MQRVFHKVALVTLVITSSAFATETDLLSLATSGAVTTAKASEAKALSSDEMKDVVGGLYTTYTTPTNIILRAPIQIITHSFVNGKLQDGSTSQNNNVQNVVQSGYSYTNTIYTNLYKETVGVINEGYLGNKAEIYARRMNSGSTTVWINYTSGGKTYQAYGLSANNLVNQYSQQAKSHL